MTLPDDYLLLTPASFDTFEKAMAGVQPALIEAREDVQGGAITYSEERIVVLFVDILSETYDNNADFLERCKFVIAHELAHLAAGMMRSIDMPTIRNDVVDRRGFRLHTESSAYYGSLNEYWAELAARNVLLGDSTYNFNLEPVEAMVGGHFEDGIIWSIPEYATIKRADGASYVTTSGMTVCSMGEMDSRQGWRLHRELTRQVKSHEYNEASIRLILKDFYGPLTEQAIQMSGSYREACDLLRFTATVNPTQPVSVQCLKHDASFEVESFLDGWNRTAT